MLRVTRLLLLSSLCLSFKNLRDLDLEDLYRRNFFNCFLQNLANISLVHAPPIIYI